MTPTATVLRDGAWCEIPRREVVPGDMIRLCAGDMISADARLLESRDLHVQQAALTGESLPVIGESWRVIFSPFRQRPFRLPLKDNYRRRNSFLQFRKPTYAVEDCLTRVTVQLLRPR